MLRRFDAARKAALLVGQTLVLGALLFILFALVPLALAPAGR